MTTVRTHIRHLFLKLGVHRRTEAVAAARALGLLAPSPGRPELAAPVCEREMSVPYSRSSPPSGRAGEQGVRYRAIAGGYTWPARASDAWL